MTRAWSWAYVLRTIASTLLFLSLIWPQLSLSQQEDTDTDTALLKIRVEKAVSLQVVGSLNPTIISVENSDQPFIDLGALSLLTVALGDYRVVASAQSPGTFGFDPTVLELRVFDINGIFVPGSEQTEFAAVGTTLDPLTLWEGGNNAGATTTATVEARLNLQQLGGDLSAESSILLNFTVVEEN